MLRLQELATSRKDVYLIPIEKLEEDFKNPREDYRTVPDLAVSMFNMGQLDPMEIRMSPDGDKCIVTAGHRRLRAAKYVNEHYEEWSNKHPDGHRFEGLLCRAEPKGISDTDRLIRQLNQGDVTCVAVPLNPIELAKAYKKLMEGGMTFAEIGRRMHKSAQAIANTMSIIDAPQELQDAVESGQMSATAASKASKSEEGTKKAKEKLAAGEKVQVKDVASYVPMTLKEAQATIKKADSFFMAEKSQVGQIKWRSIIHGIEMAMGLRPVEF